MKRTAALCTALVLACALACPALAAEQHTTIYPDAVEEFMEGDTQRLKRIYNLSPSTDPALIPTNDFEREGMTYTLLDMTKQDNMECDTKDYVEEVTLESKTKDMGQIITQLPAVREVTTEDGYTGSLTLDTSGIKVDATGYGTSSHKLSTSRTYPNLSDADLSLIPKTIVDNKHTLTLADVQWQEVGGFFTATATYTGTATGKYAKGYLVTAEYKGEVSRTSNKAVTYTAVFTGIPTQDEGVSRTVSPNMKWLMVLPAGACAAGLGVLGYRLNKKYKTKKEWEEYNK